MIFFFHDFDFFPSCFASYDETKRVSRNEQPSITFRSLMLQGQEHQDRQLGLSDTWRLFVYL